MKIIINRSALQNALAAASSVVASRGVKPVLQCVKISASGTSVSFAATDLETSVLLTTELVQVEQAGESLVPADKLSGIVRESADETLHLELVGDQLHVKGNDAYFKMYTQNPADFPPVAIGNVKPDFSVMGGAIKRLIGQTTFAAAKEATRYAFNGVLAAREGPQLVMAATDGRRLACAKASIAGETSDNGTPAIIPVRSLLIVDKLIQDGEQAIGVTLAENRATFSTSEWAFATNVIEGTFPPYNDIVPKECDRKIVAGTADLLSAVRRSSLLTNDVTRGVRMSFGPKGLHITSRDAESGEVEINFSAKLDGPPLDIGMNPVFVADALKAAETDEISFEMLAANRPGLLKAGPDFFYVVMPVNLQ